MDLYISNHFLECCFLRPEGHPRETLDYGWRWRETLSIIVCRGVGAGAGKGRWGVQIRGNGRQFRVGLLAVVEGIRRHIPRICIWDIRRQHE